MSTSAEPLSLQECQTYLSPRSRSAYKGNFGHVLIIGGEYGFQGAPRLAGEAAMRAGAGLVSIATRTEHAFAITGNCPELMSHGVKTAEDLEPLLLKATVVVLGPGLGKDNWGRALFARVLKTSLPLVVDADGLNLLAENPSTRDNWILTPHPGEAARLLQKSLSDIQNDRMNAAHMLQSKFGGIAVLKGAGTLIIGKELQPYICTAGNPGMATAGMGDILSGIIGALVAQKLSLLHAACLGVCVHAVAGDINAEKGERGMMARDLLDSIRVCLNP